MKENSFYSEVYRLCKKIPKGKVSTYKLIGDTLKTKAYRAVGQALRNNPYAPKVPCHRVVASDGSLYGFRGRMNGKALDDKKKLLEKDGVNVKNRKVTSFDKILYRFK